MGNVSCPVSPIGSPLLNSRSPQHVSGRMTPSPISSPKTTSGSSTPLTGGSGAFPFNQPKQVPYFHEGFTCMSTSASELYASGSTYHETRLDFLQGMQQGSPIYREQSSETDILSPQFERRSNGNIQESYDRQPILADRVPHQILWDPVKLKPSLELKSASPILGRTNGTWFLRAGNMIQVSVWIFHYFIGCLIYRLHI